MTHGTQSEVLYYRTDPFPSLTDTNGAVFAYAFDGEGNRVRQSLNDCLSTRFVYDGANAVAEMNASNEVVWAWIHGPGLDQPVERIAFINGETRNRQVVHADGLGSVSALTDENGEPVQTYAYAAFGGIRNQTRADLNRVTFTAREALGDSLGFIYYRHRAYDPNTGRFTSEDPMGFIDGANRYVYCRNNPVNFVDPDGRVPWMLIGAAIGGGLDLAVQLAQGRSFSEVNWVSVGAGAASGALGAGLGANVARLTASITARAALNAVGSAAIGAGVQTARNAIEGNNLGAGVGSAAVISGTVGGLGSAIGDLAERGLISVSQNSQFIQSLLDSGALQGNSHRYLLPGEIPPPSSWSTVGTAIGVTTSNLGPLVPPSKTGPCK